MTSDERWAKYFQIRDGVLTGKTAHDIAYYHMQALCNKLLHERGAVCRGNVWQRSRSPNASIAKSGTPCPGTLFLHR